MELNIPPQWATIATVVEGILIVIVAIAWGVAQYNKTMRDIDDRKDEEEGELISDYRNHEFILEHDNTTLYRENEMLRKLLREHNVDIPSNLEGVPTRRSTKKGKT